MTPSKIFLCFCLAFIIGIFLSSFFNFNQVLMLLILILGILLISVPPSLNLRKRAGLVIIGFCLLFLVAGVWRHQSVEIGIMDSELSGYNDSKQKITLTGKVNAEPDIRESSIKLTIKPKEIEGKILVTTSRYPEYQYNDELKIFGELKSPPKFEDFNYQDYLAKDGIYSVMYHPKIKKINGDPISVFSLSYGKILGFKNKLRESIDRNLSPPQSSILSAMLLGDKRKISAEWKEKLNIVGVRHITCISGMHIIILSGILMGLGIALGLWRQQAFLFAIILLVLFIIMVGAPASAVRAGIMGGLLLLAQYLGRMNTSSRAIVFAAAAMLAINPLLLKSDVGFQLSFLAVMGICYLMPIFQLWLGWIPLRFFREIFSMTLAAQVFTLPILLYNFGYMSLVAPIINCMIVPLLPFCVGLGLLFSLVGTVLPFLGWLLSLPCWLLLIYLTRVVDFFSSFSYSSLALKISWPWLLFVYSVLIFFTWHLNRKQKLKFLNY